MRHPAPKIERVWTVLDLVKWGSEFFERKEVDSPRLTIELMLCEVLKVRRLQLYTDHERPLTKEELSLLRSFVSRRAEREPLQYILGKADFYGLSFAVNPAVLIPRPETEILVDRAIRFLKELGGSSRCLDIGTGSGCIPISVATHVQSSSWECVDLKEEALTVATKNAELNGVHESCTFTRLDFLTTVPEGQFDLVTMNPPYIPLTEIHELEPEVRDHEPLTSLTDDLDGLTFYRRFATIGSQILRIGGMALLEIGFDQERDVTGLFVASGFDCTVIEDLAGIPRVIKLINHRVTKW